LPQRQHPYHATDALAPAFCATLHPALQQQWQPQRIKQQFFEQLTKQQFFFERQPERRQRLGCLFRIRLVLG
jgi:hypothetical protein